MSGTLNNIEHSELSAQEMVLPLLPLRDILVFHSSKPFRIKKFGDAGGMGNGMRMIRGGCYILQECHVFFTVGSST